MGLSMHDSNIERTLRDEGRHFLPRDFVETTEGLLFAVVEAGMEAGRVLGFLRYRRIGDSLQKFDTATANAFLADAHPALLYHSSRHDAAVHGIPLEQIALHYRPAQSLARWIAPEHTMNDCPPSTTASGVWRERLVRLAQIISGGPAIPNWLGVTGSLLVGAQQEGSDIDLVCYGRRQFALARERLMQAQTTGILQPLPEELWRDAYQRRGCSLSWAEYLWHERRKGNKFAWDGVKVDVSLIDAPPSVARRGGTKVKRAVVQCRVSDDTYAFDYPACYEVEGGELSHIVCYTPTYFGQARAGEWIEAAGWLEQDAEGDQRLLVGTSREADGEYIRVLHSPS
jgi:hypothetical protein